MRLSECALQALTELATSRGVQFEGEDGYAAKQRLGTRAMTNRSSDRAQSERRKLNLVTTHTFPPPSLEQATLPNSALQSNRAWLILRTPKIILVVWNPFKRTQTPAESSRNNPTTPHNCYIPFEILGRSSTNLQILPRCRARRYRRRVCQPT